MLISIHLCDIMATTYGLIISSDRSRSRVELTNSGLFEGERDESGDLKGTFRPADPINRIELTIDIAIPHTVMSSEDSEVFFSIY